MNTFGFAGFGAAFVGFTVLSVLLGVALRGGNASARRLLFATVFTALWALILAFEHTDRHPPALLILAGEFARDGAWLYALLGLAPATLPRFFAPVSYGLWGLWVLAALTGIRIETVMSAGGFGMALLMLLLLEQMYRNAPEVARGDLKFLAIGVGGIFTYDLFLYAQAVLLGGLDAMSWHARGLANVLLVPLLLLGARRLPDSDLRVFVSRQVTFYTTTFLAAGIYLLLMSLAGYAIRELGGAWGETARGLFLVGAFALLVILVTSAAMRRRLRVFVSKHFYRNKYDYRVEWLRFIKTLSTNAATDVPRAIVQAVAQTLDSPGGMLLTLDEPARRFVPAAAWPFGLADLSGVSAATAITAMAADDPLIDLMRRRRWIVDVREHAERPALYEHAPLPGWLRTDARWRIVAPIFKVDVLIGVLVLFDPPPPFELSFEDRDLLHTMGQHVATMLAQHEADRRVTELSQFETYNRLTAFVMHDLKNCAAQLTLVVGNAKKHRHNPEFIDDAIETVANTSERVTRLIEQLSRREIPAAPATPVRLAEIASVAVDRCRQRQPQPTFAKGLDCDSRVSADRETLVTAIEHVVRNAQDATRENGSVRIAIEDDARSVRLTVADDGAGMDADFIQHQLFRPFHSTKGSKGMGIGAYQAREFALSVGGDVEVESRPGEGTRFSFIFPVAT